MQAGVDEPNRSSACLFVWRMGPRRTLYMPYISTLTYLRHSVDDELWTPEQTAQLLSVDTSKLAEWRLKEVGPPHYLFVDEIRYSTCELETFLHDSRRLTSDSEKRFIEKFYQTPAHKLVLA